MEQVDVVQLKSAITHVCVPLQDELERLKQANADLREELLLCQRALQSLINTATGHGKN